jgi:hypothetical protein
LALLHESRTWADRSITTGEIRLATNRILVELYCPDLAEESMWLAFEEQSGWLVASVYRRGWSDTLSLPRRQTLAGALAGFYKMAGVELAREQIEAQLEPAAGGYEILDEALVVWPGGDGHQCVYRLGDLPAPEAGDEMARASADDRDDWVFAAEPISWRHWVLMWELDQLGGSSKHQVLEHLHLLPAS